MRRPALRDPVGPGRTDAGISTQNKFFIAIVKSDFKTDLVGRSIGLLPWLRPFGDDVSARNEYEHEGRMLLAPHSSSRSIKVFTGMVMQVTLDASILSRLCDHHNKLLRIRCTCYGLATMSFS